ncbi:phosphonate ABC transporter, permease protein PhnE [Mesorhizobium australicum]|uniref:Phosphonate transport system permease protein n=1 Tax=Mesorhizobium australicum TaxID=536018 RepID=A0A1X7PNE4_9HYPH|nr:phosphonate ABC transporter, permease protein PhnE [Mesorhizobium australicum]SMH52628.1 phosphonate transport system permease protein [Mesorhizobium australicum]
MPNVVTAEMREVAARYPAALEGSARKSLVSWAVAGGFVLYLVFAWWFFSIGSVFANAKWDIAGTYLADWVSYEVRPNIDLRDGHLDVKFTRFDPLGPNGNPDWLARETAMVVKKADQIGGAGGGASSSSGSFLGPVGGAPAPTGSAGAAATPSVQAAPAAPTEEVVRATVDFSGAGTVDVRPDQVTVTRGDETLVLDIVRNEAVNVRGALPSWASQRSPGDKVIVYFGVPGRAEIESDEVKIRHRFLGWANFVFDINSPFWGKSAGEVFDLIVSGERIDPSRSNLSLAWDNILYNADWQHLDVWTKLLQTIVMAFAGTVLASLIAFPLAFVAARNIMPNRLLNQVAKRFFDFQRSVDMLIWALFFTRAFGPGPLAGISAIFFTDTGTLGKLYSEALENIDDKQREGVRSVGAAPAVVQRYGVVPQVLPVFLSQSLYFWESNTRSATIIGAVGAGGIGLKLWEAIRTNSDWENVAYMVILILIVVFIFDNISTALRQRLIAPPAGPT